MDCPSPKLPRIRTALECSSIMWRRTTSSRIQNPSPQAKKTRTHNLGCQRVCSDASRAGAVGGGGGRGMSSVRDGGSGAVGGIRS